MPIQTPKSGSQYAQEILAALQATGIQNTTPGGKARALADIIADRMGDLETRQFIAATQNLLPYATDIALDSIGDIFNEPRISAQDSSSPASDGNFEFFVQSGTFGTINSGQDITVPAGTQIFTSSQNGTIYTLDTDVSLLAASSSAVFSASAQIAGSAGNAPAGVFNRHNFRNYTQSSFGILLVTNNFGIIGGREAEDDESYRFRLRLKLQSSGGNGEVDIRASVLRIPGIQDLVFSPLAGTYLVYVYGISPDVPPSLLQLVQIAIEQHTSYPLTGTAIVPDLIGVSLSTTLHLKSGLSTTDQVSIVTAAQQAASNYINNLDVGQQLIINHIGDLIMNADTRILDVGDPDKPLQEVFIWRSRLDGTRFSRFLINNYSPVLGERIVVENTPNAINLTVAIN